MFNILSVLFVAVVAILLSCIILRLLTWRRIFKRIRDIDNDDFLGSGLHLKLDLNEVFERGAYGARYEKWYLGDELKVMIRRGGTNNSNESLPTLREDYDNGKIVKVYSISNEINQSFSETVFPIYEVINDSIFKHNVLFSIEIKGNKVRFFL